MTLLRVDASIQGDRSASSSLADLVVAEFAAARPDEHVVTRHLGADPLPGDAWAAAVSAGWTPAGRAHARAAWPLELAERLADELRQADAAVLALPLYNFGVSQHVKTWIDLAIAGAPHGSGAARRHPHGPADHARRLLRARHPTRGLGPQHRLPAPDPGRHLGRGPDRGRARVHPRRRQPGPRRVHRAAQRS